jgi:hypothetical protein
MPFVLFVGSGEVASDERSPLRGGGTQGQDFQARGKINFFYTYRTRVANWPIVRPPNSKRAE